jgi:hypothetical protein
MESEVAGVGDVFGGEGRIVVETMVLGKQDRATARS